MKIAIIGAGVCGLYLAKNLAQKGNEVLVFEKKKTIGKQCCSGLFSARLFDFFPEARQLETNQINRAIINFPKRTVNIKFRQPFFVIEHAMLDLLAAGIAVQAGAAIRTNSPVDSQKLEALSLEYDRVIGADGALSPTRDIFYDGLTVTSLRRSDRRRNRKIEFWLGIQGFEKKNG
jgi:Dehydrogenases (flavoproteins)